MEHTLPFRNRFLLLFWGFTFFVFFFSGKSIAQSFTGTYSFGTGGNVTSFAYNGDAITNLTVAPITKNGVTSHSSTSFRATLWPTGSVSGGAAGGSVNTGKYFEFTITATGSYTISNPTITFGVSRNSAGPRRFYWASNVDNYVTAMPVTTLGSVAMTNTNGIIEVPDNTTVYPDNVVSLIVSGRTSITFRFYAYGSEGDSGQGGFPGNLTFSGTLTAGQTGTAPTVSTLSASAISSVSATLEGNVSSDGGNALTGSGFVYSTTDSTPTIVEGATVLAADSPSLGVFSENTVNDLAVNTLYFFRAYATNGIGTSYGAPYSFYTLANVPVLPNVGSPTTNSLNVAIGSGDGNPAGTQYAIQVDGLNYVQNDGSLDITPFWQTAANWSTKTVSGLSPLTSYDFRVKARNADDEETDFSGVVTGMTISNESPVIVANNLVVFGSACLNSSVVNSFDLSGYNLNTSDITIGPLEGFAFSDTEEGTYSAILTLTPADGLIDETVYVKFTPLLAQTYDNSFSISGGGANAVNVDVEGVGINTPADVTTGSATAVSATGATLSLSYEMGCSTVTSFGIEYSTANNFTNSTTVTGSLSLDVSGLLPNTQYYFRGFATDATGLVNGSTANFTTLNLNAPTAIGATNITATSFEANWISVPGATSYRLDVSTLPTFGSTVATPNVQVVNNTGTTNTPGWTETAITVPGTGYIGLQSANSTLITPTMNLSNFTGTTLNFRARTQGGVSGLSNVITISISTDNGVTFPITLGTRTPTSTSFAAMGAFDLSAFVGTQVKIRIQTLNANGTSGVGLDDIIVAGTRNDFVPSFVSGYNNKVISDGASTSSLVDVNLSANTIYHYRVRAVSTNSTSVNSNSISVTTALPTPTFGAITQNSIQCSGTGTTTFGVQGLLIGYSNTLYYSLNGIEQTPINVSADLSGNAVFTLSLTDLNNGQLLTITSIEITDNPESNVLVPESVDSVVVLAVNSPPTWYLDTDGDGYYTGTPVVQCASPGIGYTTTVLGGGDCDDAKDFVYPGAPEICFNNVDDDCDGLKSEGCQLIASSLTNSYPNNFVLGSISTTILSTIPVVAGYPITGYIFEITRLSDNVTAPELYRPNNKFNLTMTNIYAYDTQFAIRVRVIVNGEEQPYLGDTRIIRTPALASPSLLSTQCDTSIPTIGTTIFSASVTGATDYEFTITSSSFTNPVVQVIPRQVNNFRLSMMPDYSPAYNTVYTVSVRVRVAGAWSNSPSTCTITTPGVPTTSLVGSQCGFELATLNTTITAIGVANATGYVFKVSKVNEPAIEEEYPVTGQPLLRLNMLSTISADYETAYNVWVKAVSTVNGITTEGAYATTPCVVTTPLTPSVSIVNVSGDCEAGFTPETFATVINSETYPGARYRFILRGYSLAEELVYDHYVDRNSNDVTLSMFPTITPNLNYYISVALRLPGEVVSPKEECLIFIPSMSKASLVTSNDFTVKAYPNPFETNFMIAVATESQSPVSIKVYDMVGRLVEQRESKVSNMSNLTIGEQYPSGVYNVVVTQDEEVQTLRVVKR